MKILITDGKLKLSDQALFLRAGAALDIESVQKKPFPWMTDEAWLNVVEIANKVPFFKTLKEQIRSGEAVWRKWHEDNAPEALPLPDYETQIQANKDLGPFMRLLLVRCLRVDRTMLCVSDFVSNTPKMGQRYVEPASDTIEELYSAMTAEVPVIYLLSVGNNPTEAIELLAKKRKQTVEAVSMGEGQEPVAKKAIESAMKHGSWVLLQNCELGLDLMFIMEEHLRNLFKAGEVNENFRLFFTALPHPDFPLGLLQMCTKVVVEPPSGLRAGLMRSYTVMVDQDRLERIDTAQWRKLLNGLCFLHSVVQERKKFGSLGWCIPYEFNAGDLNACIMFLEKHLFDNDKLSWQTTQYMVSQVQYGGKITDDFDRRLFNTYAKLWVTEQSLAPDFTFNPPDLINPIENDFVYRLIDDTEVSSYQKFMSTLPRIDSPEIFGLHPNADLTFRTKEVLSFLATLGETQPKSSGASSGISREDIVHEKCGELLEKLPAPLVEDEYMSRIKKLGGLDVPLNIFLYQEVQRLQNVIEKVRSTLINLRLAIKGEVVLTVALVQCMDDIFNAAVPKVWLYTVAGDELSWLLPTLGLWFGSLTLRYDQMSKWLETGRPNTFWMTGFFNPQGFLTAMKQEVTRQHKADKWALDDVVYHSELTQFESQERVLGPPKEGLYVHGLFLDGAQWDTKHETIIESEPKKLFDAMPVLYVTALAQNEQKKRVKELYGAHGPYECPCYKYPVRQDRYLVFTVCLITKDKTPEHWILRGCALLCSKE